MSIKLLRQSHTATTTSVLTSSYPPASRNGFQMESGTSSVNNHTKSVVTSNSCDLYPTTSTFKFHSAPTEQEAAGNAEFIGTNGPPGDTKFVTNGPPSYSSLYHS